MLGVVQLRAELGDHGEVDPVLDVRERVGSVAASPRLACRDAFVELHHAFLREQPATAATGAPSAPRPFRQVALGERAERLARRSDAGAEHDRRARR